jgi:hypothetical protein
VGESSKTADGEHESRAHGQRCHSDNISNSAETRGEETPRGTPLPSFVGC